MRIMLAPGDVLLIAGSKGALATGIIRSGMDLTEPHKQWTHAALYVGNGDIAEATLLDGLRGEVVWRPLDVYASRPAILHGRMPHLSQEAVRAILGAAAAMKGAPYSVGRAITLAVQTFARRRTPPPTTPAGWQQGLICSDFVVAAYTNAKLVLIEDSDDLRTVSPATLARSTALRWQQVVPSQLVP